MSDDQHRDPTLERYLAAYRQAEPRRRHSPFTDPRLAEITASRTARAASPWRRILATSPLAPLAPAMLALALTLAPAPSVLPGVAPMAAEGAPTLAATPVADSMNGPLVSRSEATELGIDPWRLATLGIALARLSIALRRTRRRA